MATLKVQKPLNVSSLVGSMKISSMNVPVPQPVHSNARTLPRAVGTKQRSGDARTSQFFVLCDSSYCFILLHYLITDPGGRQFWFQPEPKETATIRVGHRVHAAPGPTRQRSLFGSGWAGGWSLKAKSLTLGLSKQTILHVLT